jgi:nucleotide-binding universal stress UspA family protein
LHLCPGGRRQTLYRKILVPLSETAAGHAALRLGLDLATRFGAHLAAVIVRVDASSVAPLVGEGLSGAMIENMMAATERAGTDRARTLTAWFDAAVTGAGIAVTTAPGPGAGPTAALQTVTGRDEEILPALAQLADLTILPHPSDDPDGTGADRLHTVLFDSGRPVLIAPPAVPQTLGSRCCVAWNGSTEGAAALAAMVPWLRAAAAVRVIHATEYQRRGAPAEALLPYLALHGIEAEIVAFRPVNRDLGAGLLAAAAAFGADLLGMGAYSHSRLRQLILGGVTRHVLGHARLPVLMSR